MSKVRNKDPETVNIEKIPVTFRGNRKYDLHIGREMITFLSRETKEIPKKWLNHPDWLQAKKLFVISGISNPKKEDPKEEEIE
jgi:hypothetical protein